MPCLINKLQHFFMSIVPYEEVFAACFNYKLERCKQVQSTSNRKAPVHRDHNAGHSWIHHVGFVERNYQMLCLYAFDDF